MTAAPTLSPQLELEAECLLGSLAGILAARVSRSPLGRLVEVHVLASPEFNAKQIVRNVESALAAGLGIMVDRRMISVAQIRSDVFDPLRFREAMQAAGLESHPPAPATDETTHPPHPDPLPPPGGEGNKRASPRQIPSVPPASQRIVFQGWDASRQPHARAECRVTMRRNGAEVAGTGTGPATSQGRALAAARAVFNALAEARGLDDLLLEDARLVESHGRGFVLVAARLLLERGSRPLTGAAPVSHSPEHAAILAALQATNRWTGKED